MIPAVTIKTIQFEELNRQLEGLQADLQIRARKGGLLAMAQPLTKDIRSTTPVKTGALRSSIGHQWLKDAEVAVQVGSVRRVTTGAMIRAVSSGFAIQSKRRMQDYKMRWLEEGTKPHMVMAWQHGKRLTTWQVRKLNDVRTVVSPSVTNAGMRARWIQRSAFQRNQGQFLEQFQHGAARALAKYGVVVS